MVRDVAAALDFLHTKGEPGLGLSAWVGLVASEGQGRGAGQVQGWELVQLAGRGLALAPSTEATWPSLLQGQSAGACRRRPLHSPALGWPALPQACLQGQLLRGARPAFSSVPF